MQKTITVRTIIRTPKGIILKVLSGEEYIYDTFENDEILSIPGNVVNITYDDKNKITDAMFMAFTPDAIELAAKLEKAKTKTAEILKPKTPEPVRTPAPKPPPNAMNKSVSLAYSKDLVIAGKLPLADLLPCAEVFYQYMTGELEVANLYPTLLLNTKMPKEGD